VTAETADPAAHYAARATHHERERDGARRLADRLGVARLLAALALVGALVLRERGSLPSTPALTLAALCALVFALLVRAHGRARRRERAAALRHTVSVRGAARLRRDWAALPVPAWRVPPDAPWPPLAEDLYLLGRASLAQLLDVVTPLLGGPRMAAWLLSDPPAVPVIRERQTAVRALARGAPFLEECAALAEGARAVSPRAFERLVAWAESPAAGTSSGWLRIAAVVGPLLMLTAIGLGAAGVVPLGGAIGAAAVVNLTMSGLASRALRPLLSPLDDLPTLLAPALALLAHVDAEPVDVPAWHALQRRLRRAGGRAAMARLARWISWAEVRHSPMLYGLLAAALAWDAVLYAGLDGWRRTSGPAVRDWFDALADAEALVALATLAHDNPGWGFPEPIDGSAPAGEASLDGVALGHPLLAAGTRVTNPVRLGAPGSLLMVSGSNMAGKTTLLRAVGANVLLAQAGGPVCAAAMRWRPVRVRTSVRVHDALDAGVSLFLAELRRLRDVVAAADGTADGAGDGRTGRGAPVLFLFDEVLHGTNSHDRREATRAVLARLAARGAVGVVTTHDLELADDPGLAPATAHVHFRERYASADGGPRMEFDYLARPGRATTTNALALLELLGLGR
jgi:hypothetical protein